MISGAPSQEPRLPDNGNAADYQQLRERLTQELNLTPQQLHEACNLIQAGLDSIRLMRWLDWFRKRGYRVTLRELYAAPHAGRVAPADAQPFAGETGGGNGIR
ncbi:irp2 [Klebsiella oxytoca]|nr:irp2 [Klebsiella oxytoca]